MTNRYYQKHKERLRKEAREKYKNRSEEEKDKRRKKAKKDIAIFFFFFFMFFITSHLQHKLEVSVPVGF